LRKKKKIYRDWTDQESEEEDLPPVLLLAEDRFIQIYSSANHYDEEFILCEDNQMDDLAERAGHNPDEDKTVLNLKNPRIQSSLAQFCLTRPNDLIFSVGRGENALLTMEKFHLRKEYPLCPNKSAYGLYATTEPSLESTPLFYSTDLQLKEGPNHFTPKSKLKIIPASDNLKIALSQKIKFLEEYSISVSSVGASNFDALIHIKKKSTHSEDVGLPNEIILWSRGKNVTILITERVEKSRKSGHVDVIGVLDFNQDNQLDLFIKGDQDGCPYQAVFKGRKEGFERHSIPRRRCRC